MCLSIYSSIRKVWSESYCSMDATPVELISPTLRHCIVWILINHKKLEIPSLGTQSYLQISTRYCSSFLRPILVMSCHLDRPRGRFVRVSSARNSRRNFTKTFGERRRGSKQKKIGCTSTPVALLTSVDVCVRGLRGSRAPKIRIILKIID
jgi:hypothetical protein